MKRKKTTPAYNEIFGRAPAVVSKEFSLWVAENKAQRVRYSVIIKKNT